MINTIQEQWIVVTVWLDEQHLRWYEHHDEHENEHDPIGVKQS
jgi:heme-degrading monooxygenase HmoA